MKIVRSTNNKKLNNLKFGDVFSWLNCMSEDRAPAVYRVIDYKTLYSFTENKVINITDKDANELVYQYNNAALDLSDK